MYSNDAVMQSSLFNQRGCWQAGIVADFFKVIRNLHFIQLQITCDNVIEIQLQLLDLKCNSITITITEAELVIQLRISITCISITEQHC